MQMISNLRSRKKGFTLIELLVVMAILIILLAFLVPLVMNQWTRIRIRNTELTLKSSVLRALEDYKEDHGNYPTTEAADPNDFLPRVLIGDTSRIQQQQQPGGMGAPGGLTNGGMPTQPGGLTPPMPGQDMMMQQPGGLNPPMPGQDTMMQQPGGLNPAVPGPTAAVGTPMPGMDGGLGMPNPGMQNPGGMSGMPDQTGGFGPTGTPGVSTTPGGMSGVSTTHGARLTNNYFGENASLPEDAWNRPFKYEYPTYKTPSGKPAVWSAGPDGIYGNDDDIISWADEMDAMKKDPALQQRFEQKRMQEQQRQQQLQMQQMQQQTTGMGGMPGIPGQPPMPGQEGGLMQPQQMIPGQTPPMPVGPGMDQGFPTPQPTPGPMPTTTPMQPTPGPMPTTTPQPNPMPVPPQQPTAPPV